MIHWEALKQMKCSLVSGFITLSVLLSNPSSSVTLIYTNWAQYCSHFSFNVDENHEIDRWKRCVRKMLLCRLRFIPPPSGINYSNSHFRFVFIHVFRNGHQWRACISGTGITGLFRVRRMIEKSDLFPWKSVVLIFYFILFREIFEKRDIFLHVLMIGYAIRNFYWNCS